MLVLGKVLHSESHHVLGGDWVLWALTCLCCNTDWDVAQVMPCLWILHTPFVHVFSWARTRFSYLFSLNSTRRATESCPQVSSPDISLWTNTRFSLMSGKWLVTSIWSLVSMWLSHAPWSLSKSLSSSCGSSPGSTFFGEMLLPLCQYLISWESLVFLV